MSLEYNIRSVRKAQNSIRRQVLKNKKRKRKYKWYFRGLKVINIISPVRGPIINAENYAMRNIDDVTDEDIPLPESASSKKDYIDQRIRFWESIHENDDNKQIVIQDPADLLLYHVYRSAKKIGLDFREGNEDILASLKFDAERFGSMRIFPKKELNDHFFLLDIRGTIQSALKLYGENPEGYTVLKPLGFAARIYYNLRDYEDDISKWYVNISAEDFERYGMTEEKLKPQYDGSLSEEVQRWFVDQAKEGLRLLDVHGERMRNHKFKPLTRFALWRGFSRPAKKYLENVLRMYNHK